MKPTIRIAITTFGAALPLICSLSANAEVFKSPIAFNTSIQTPADGGGVYYAIDLGGDLTGCKDEITEKLIGHDDGARGYFEIMATVTCADGSFTYSVLSAWGGNGFTSGGRVADQTGRFAGRNGRVMQINGGAAPSDANNGTLDVSYDLIMDFDDA